MTLARLARVVVLTVLITAVGGSIAHAQTEVGASLLGASFLVGDDENVTVVGMPTSTFGGSFNPGVYASFFLGPRMAVEPRFSFVFVSFDSESDHALNLTGQFDYFLTGTTQSSMYLFGNGGFIETSGDVNGTTFGAGVGYRIPVGDRLVFRLEGQYMRIMPDSEFDEDADALSFTVLIGGVFGR